MKTFEETKIGDIVYVGFGYEAYVVDFFQVVRKTAKSVFVKPMGDNRRYISPEDWYSSPGAVQEDGRELRLSFCKNWRKVQGRIVSDYDGRSINCYNYH